MRFRRFLSLFLAAALLFSLALSCRAATYQPPFSVSAESALLVCLDTDTVVYEKNADTPLEPSLLAQMMTAVLAIEQIDDLDNTMLSMSAYVQDEMYTKNIALGGIRLSGLYKGEEISAKKLLYALLVRDACDAAMILADYLGDGSISYFTEQMNTRAAELGMTNTHFTDPTGLADPKAATTARDIAILAEHARSLPFYTEIANTTFYNGGPTALQETLYWNTTDKLISPSSDYYNAAVEGVKTGWHDTLGSYAVSAAVHDGQVYLCVVMAAADADETAAYHKAFAETNALYEWLFETFSVKVLLEEGKSFGEVPLRLGADGKDFLRVRAASAFTAMIPNNIGVESVQYRVVLPASVSAPVKEGDLIGEVHLTLADEEIGVVALVASEDAAASSALRAADTLASLTKTFWFKFVVVFVFLLVILYLVLLVARNRNRRYPRRRR